MRVAVIGATSRESALVQEVLLDLGAEVLDPRTIRPRTQWSEHLAGWWKDVDVDAVVAVLTAGGGRYYESILFELGIAFGRRLPLLVLQGDEPTPLPIDLAEVSSARTNLQNAEALRFHLELFLHRVSAGMATEPPPAEAHRVDVEELRRSLDELRRSRSPKTRGQDYERWVVRLFRLAGADVVESRSPRERGFDLAVALPGVSPDPSPLLVEVKVTARPLDLTDAAFRLQELVLRERAGLGLLLYEDGSVSYEFGVRIAPIVLAMALDELLFLLGRHDGSLTEALRTARNEAVHRL
jgi:hypothetical protein